MWHPFNPASLGRRRRFLLQALAGVLFAASGSLARSQVLGQVPRRLPPVRSVYDLRGRVEVNGRPATQATFIDAGATISTQKDSQLIFAVGADAFVVRENSTLALSGDSVVIRGLRLVTGGLLSVFGTGDRSIVTPTANIGIRGTGLYLEARPDQTYVCTCYGTAEIAAANAASQRETVVSRHHDAPRYVFAAGGTRIRPAPVINHTDLELALLEALVGRTLPFGLFDENYGGPGDY